MQNTHFKPNEPINQIGVTLQLNEEKKNKKIVFP